MLGESESETATLGGREVEKIRRSGLEPKWRRKWLLISRPTLTPKRDYLLVNHYNQCNISQASSRAHPPPHPCFVLAAAIPREPLSVRGEAATPTCGSAGPNMFQSERARHSYDVEEDEEEAEESDAWASTVENGAAVKLVRHLAHTGAQSGGGSGTDLRHVVHCHPHRVRLESSGFVKWSLEDSPGFQTEWAFVPLWHGAGSR